MKLASYCTATGPSFGAVDGDRIVDLRARLGPACPDLRSLLAGDALEAARRAVRGAIADFRVDEVVFLPVVPNPGKIVCAGLNYEAHRVEGNRPRTTDPALFLRLPESQTGHRRPLVRPVESTQFDFEGEIALVVGRRGRRIPEAHALEHVAGYACYNDGSVRDWQLSTSQWTPGKNFPATGAFGPWLALTDELPAGAPLELVTRLNGQEVQRATTDMMIFSIPTLIAFISTFTTLEPGDVIVTGTPGGVGMRRDPPLFMKEGDLVEVEVSGVGTLVNPVVSG